MIRYPVTALAAAFAVPVYAAPAPELVQVQAHLRAVTTMTAAFQQIDATGKTRAGMLTLKRPGKIRFQYEKGVPLLIVGDGKALTMIDYQVRQVSRWPIGDSPLAALIDPNRDVSRYGRLIPAPPGRILVEGKDPKHPEFGTITIGFTKAPSAPGGLMLAGWTVMDAQGNRSTVVLTDQRFGMAISDKAFLWSDPRPQNRGR
ncbi:outer membrane lipoprotein carrier protein LolA [Sphingomonas sp. BIUV-7]|uniref:Outer membrane lipoprotein carrier protein LolA n=1 Tax=Sphingomonas natans TaxID=3063330 RepID=A0ABT8YE08_9SPHN|nr:outer membrane lipoprotein carrier protein LolA [Sphingomonas sp. BIUV-7]MDO6416023.1 outer membrane lipoprotein carrier protein LolA [Sphingomonas sp. BIUV-7]